MVLFQGTELIFTDFGNFPVFFIGSGDFDNAVEVWMTDIIVI